MSKRLKKLLENVEAQYQRLGPVIEQAILAEPGVMNRARQRDAGVEIEQAPVSHMATASPAIDTLRQFLPENVGDTEIGRRATAVLPDELQAKVNQIRLGGLTEDERAGREHLRDKYPEVAEQTTYVGETTEGPTSQRRQLTSKRERLAQAVGSIINDVMTDGMRNIWWFLNAPQAITQIAVLQGINTAKQRNMDTSVRRADSPVFQSRGLRMAASAPAVIAVSMGLGNAYRQPGYKAVVPDEDDPTKSANLLAEGIDRYFLGRSGQLLPYDEFVKERPDVSRAEYNQYKQYLFGNKGVVKATMDGVQGPEVTFMGKSLPLMTAILPGAAGVLGVRRGIRRGLEKQQLSGALEKEKRINDLAAEVNDRNYEGPLNPERVNAVARNRRKENDKELFLQAIKDASIATSGAALSGALLESIRRANRPRQELEE